jgi:hypothetical protein
MGKKGKKSFYKKRLRPLLKQNRVLLAALGGALTGITIAGILGTEKAKQIANTLEGSVKNFARQAQKRMAASDHIPESLRTKLEHN